MRLRCGEKLVTINLQVALPLNLDHICERRLGGPLMLFDPDDQNNSWEATEWQCPACQWLAGVEWLRDKTGLPLAAIQAGVVGLMRDVGAAVWEAYIESTGLDILNERIKAQEDNLARIEHILAGVISSDVSAEYQRGYADGRALFPSNEQQKRWDSQRVLQTLREYQAELPDA